MRRRHPLPRLWLMSDERTDDVIGAVAALPKGSGIVFRHYATPPRERRALFRQVRKLARAKGHVLLLADLPAIAQSWGADGAHHRAPRASRGIRSVAVHSPAERMTAKRAKADLIFVSPVFSTRSHPGAPHLGPVRLGLTMGCDRDHTIALGGMNPARFRRLTGLGLYGWAGIDAFRT